MFMNRKFGIGILALCFGLSSVNVSLAAQVIEISPVIVQPYDLREISQQMLEQDRVNRDQELAIRGLIDDNQKMMPGFYKGCQPVVQGLIFVDKTYTALYTITDCTVVFVADKVIKI